MKTILIICGVALSFMLAIAGFILAGSGQENLFYTGAGFGLAAILVMSITLNRTQPKKVQAAPEEK